MRKAFILLLLSICLTAFKAAKEFNPLSVYQNVPDIKFETETIDFGTINKETCLLKSLNLKTL